MEIDLQIEIDDAFDTVFVLVVMTEQLVNRSCVLQKANIKHVIAKKIREATGLLN